LGDYNGALQALEQYLAANSNHKPEWANQRISELRDKAAGAAAAKP